VILVCRSKDKGDQARQEIENELKTYPHNAKTNFQPSFEVMLLDLADFSSIRNFAKEFLEKHAALHILVLNAGMVSKEYVETKEGFEVMFAVNHLGHFLLTNLLLDRIKQTSPGEEKRIVVVSSEAHNFPGPLKMEQLTTPPKYGLKDSLVVYGRSKLCNLLFEYELNRRLESFNQDKEKGTITINSLHPGTIKTEIGREAPWYLAWLITPLAWINVFKTAKRGARTSILLASSDKLNGVTGVYYSEEKLRKPKPYARDPEAAKQLWDLSAKLTKLVESEEEVREEEEEEKVEAKQKVSEEEKSKD